MAGEKRCPQCGAELPPGSLEGLCPKCLMAVGMESGAATVESPLRASGAAASPDSTRFVPPTAASLASHFPQLEILELLGHGGMGAVYKARQKNLDRLVALKIIRPESADTPAFAERFNREARMLARLNHPHIVAIYDFGEVNVSDPGGGSRPPRRLYFFLMEYVDGSSLRQQMRAGDLTPEKALKVVPQICEALQYAHDEGIVHRDIKPENILLDKRGRVKIADFGLAKLAAGSASDYTLTATHHVLGTVRYMAPEQMEGSHAVDHRADIYSLGVVFYEMLTREVPAGHFEPPSKKVQIDVRLDEVVLRALAREPERRYQHASDVKDEVESIAKLLPREKTWAQSDEARLKLQSLLAPAVAMLAIGTALTVWLALAIAGRLPSDFEDWWVVGIGGPLLLLGGIAMSGGRSYWLALAASLVCMAIGFATLYFIFFVPFVPLAALLVGGFSLWRLMQPDVQEAFGQRSTSGGAFRRRRLVITLTLVLPMLALVCAVPLFMTQIDRSRNMLARRDVESQIAQNAEPSPDSAPPPASAPDVPAPVVAEEEPEEGPPAVAKVNVAQRSVAGGETVRMRSGGNEPTPKLAGVGIDYAPYQYDRQQITLFGDTRRKNAIVFIFDCSKSMTEPTLAAPPAGNPGAQLIERMKLAKNHFALMLDELAKRNAEGEDTHVGVRFFGHRSGWLNQPASTGGGPRLAIQDDYVGTIPDQLNPAEDVELVLPLGRFDIAEAEKIRRVLASVKPWGETPLYLAVMQALGDFDGDRQDTRNSIVVITDGENYQSLFNPDGRKQQATTLNMLLDRWQRHKSKIPVHILGFDLANQAAARARAEYTRLAKITGGSFAEIATGKELLDALRRQTALNAYVVCNEEGAPLKQTASGNENPTPLNTPFDILTSRLPQKFTVLFGPARKQIELEGGEAIQLYVPNSRVDIVAKAYEGDVIDQEVLVGRTSGSSTDYIVRAHRPTRQNASIKFPISLQRNTEVSHFTVRPAETWVEITPTDGNENLHKSYVFYDTNYEPLKPVPVLAWWADDWPAEADRARIRFWCKYGRTPAMYALSIKDVLQSPTKYAQFRTVTDVDGAALKVEMPTTPDGKLQIRVTERHNSATKSGPNGIRVQLQTDSGTKPIRVSHEFDPRNGYVGHSYYFSPEQRKYIETSELARILVARESDVKEAALQLPTDRDLVVPVGLGLDNNSPAAPQNGQ